MKKSLLLLCFLALLLALLGCSCNDEQNEEFTVTFKTYIDVKIEKQIVPMDQKVIAPTVALERAGYKFEGWYDGKKKWSFDTDKVTKDIELTAKWERYLTFTQPTDGSDGLWVAGCDFDVENAVIPSEYNGKTITGIYWGFTDRKKLKTVYIPNTVTYINREAFVGCDSLTTIYCEAEEMPSGWNNALEGINAQIIWGHKQGN